MKRNTTDKGQLSLHKALKCWRQNIRPEHKQEVKAICRAAVGLERRFEKTSTPCSECESPIAPGRSRLILIAALKLASGYMEFTLCPCAKAVEAV